MTKLLVCPIGGCPGTLDGMRSGLDIAPQQPHTKRMESRNHRLGDRKSAHQLIHALDHLRRSLVGKGHRQDGFRHDAQILDQMGDAVGDDARLAAARAGQDEHRPFGGFDSFALLRIEFFEKRQMKKRLRFPTQFYRTNSKSMHAEKRDHGIYGDMSRVAKVKYDP